MVAKRALLLLLPVLVLTSACCCPWTVRRAISNLTEEGSGRTVTREYDLTGFSEVVISHAFQAEVTHSESYRVSVTIDDNLERYLKVEKRGAVLYVGLESVTLMNRATLQASISLPDLRSLEASGASTVDLSGFRPTGRLNLEVSGASTVRGDLEAQDVRFRISGASTVTLKGSARDGDIEVSGASRARLEDLQLVDARVEASGASSAHVTLSGRLDAEASGASTITYGGNPTLGRISQSGASSVKQR
ncbi:MAG: hypothetical protein BWY10_01454 [Chloroflexi bacterium ADurb.Bin180]|nr:MAG: hypothetical protein BWY10_01454 [Chloroflexi bacterium ADurb.Bin180]HOU24672.1 head GIN domain-containing protein [Anaerolineae bacterium]